jgi:hypothetical protein
MQNTNCRVEADRIFFFLQFRRKLVFDFPQYSSNSLHINLQKMQGEKTQRVQENNLLT